MASPDQRPTVSLALGHVVEAAQAWVAAADAGAGAAELLGIEAEALASLGEPQRVFFFGLVGVSGSHGESAGSAFVLVRAAALEAGTLLFAQALAGELAATPAIDRVWADVSHGKGATALVAAVSLALGGVLPLALDHADVARAHGDPVISALVGLAIGRAARGGDQGAAQIARDLLTSGRVEDLEIGVIKGLGGGIWSSGLAWIAMASTRSAFEQDAWSRACRGATLIAVADTPEAVHPVLLEGLAGADSRSDADDFVTTVLAACPSEGRVALADAVASRWSAWAPLVRAAVVGVLAEHPQLKLEVWLGERSAVVIRAMLRAIDSGGASLSEEDQRRLCRLWANHPDTHVRRAIAHRLVGRGAIGASAASAPDVGELVALPPSALVRNPLDRLRAALWMGESDQLVELARAVPGEDRLVAREALFQALEIPNAALRRACVEAIAYIGHANDGPRLLNAARTYRALEGTVAAAARQLGATGQAEALAELYQRRLKWADDDAVDDYCAIAGPERVMYLLAALETRFYPGARAGAARAIARAGAHEVVFALRNRGLSDPQEASRAAALSALQELTGTTPSADEMAGYALAFRPADELPDAIDRARAAGKAALPGIRRTLAKGSWRRRRAACDALVMIPGREAEEVLVGALLDSDEDVRMTAIEALLERGWSPGSPRERTLASVAARRIGTLDPDGVDVATLELALGLGGHAFRAELLEVVERFAAWRPSRASAAAIWATRLDGARALACDGGLAGLLRALDHTWQANPHRARLARALHDHDAARLAHELAEGGWDWRAREALCQALGRPGVDTGVDALGDCVVDDDDDVRRAALTALVVVGTAAAAEATARGFQSPFQEYREFVATALAAFGDEAHAIVARLARDPWWEGRQGAAMTLRVWRGNRQAAADLLVVLATDPEYRVSHPAREGLEAHGLMPRRAAVRTAVERAQVTTIEGLEAWVGITADAEPDPEIADWLDTLVERAAPDALPQRLGLIPLFRVEHLAIWLEDAALGRTTRHVGIRLAAADALRALVRRHCAVCVGDGAVRCPECDGAGDRPCQRCGAQTIVLVDCPEPECTARQATRRIDSRRCPTCRGKGQVPVACDCAAAGGRSTCALCRGTGRIGCVACGETGAAPRPDEAGPG